MAFDAAARGGGAAAAGGGGEGLLAMTSQRVASLVQTMNQLERMIGAVGTAGDNPTLRSRMATAETKADSLRAEIDGNLRRLRTEGVGRADGPTLRSMEVLTEQYSDVRKRLADLIKLSQAMQARNPVPTVVNPLATATAAAAASGGASSSGGRGGAGEAMHGLELQEMGIRALDDVDVAIAQERREAAIEIAQEAVAVHEVVKDISTMVNAQGEMVDKIETEVTAAETATVAAVKDIKQASKYQSGKRKLCVIAALLIIILIACVVVPIVIHVLPKQ